MKWPRVCQTISVRQSLKRKQQASKRSRNHGKSGVIDCCTVPIHRGVSPFVSEKKSAAFSLLAAGWHARWSIREAPRLHAAALVDDQHDQEFRCMHVTQGPGPAGTRRRRRRRRPFCGSDDVFTLRPTSLGRARGFREMDNFRSFPCTKSARGALEITVDEMRLVYMFRP